MPGQTVQTNIRQLLEEQSDQALHCLLYTPTLLYRGDSCIGDFTYHVNFQSQRHLAIVYVQNISRQISNSHLQQKFCKMSSIVTIRFMHLQMACRKQYSAYYGYPRPINTHPVPLKYFIFISFESGSVVQTSEVMPPYLVTLPPYMENFPSMPKYGT